MNKIGWVMWVDAHLKNDYHYNNGYLSFVHLLPGHSNNDRKNKLEDYFDIFRYKLEDYLKSITIHFEKTNS